MQRYEEELKQRIVRLHLEEGSVSKASISIWMKAYREGCQTNQENKEDYDFMLENRRLRKELSETQKENLFLKKVAAFFAKEID